MPKKKKKIKSKRKKSKKIKTSRTKNKKKLLKPQTDEVIYKTKKEWMKSLLF